MDRDGEAKAAQRSLDRHTPLILDFDRTAGEIGGAFRVDMAAWQEEIRFGCSLKRLSALAAHWREILPAHHGTVLLGSGDFHHLSWPLIERCAGQGPFQVVLFDNHPDNMRFPFGVHCGSWVRKVALLPYVSHVHVVGITSTDIGLGSAWEQYWRPLLQGKLTYWCMGVDVGWANYAGLARAFRRYAAPEPMIADFLAELGPEPVYLTIDKDVLSLQEIHTNWDQGILREGHLMQAIAALQGRIIGSDITGDISSWTYRTRWKRWLSARDGQIPVPPEKLIAWQADQRALNQRLLTAIARSGIVA